VPDAPTPTAQQPLAAALAVGQTPALKEPRLCGGWLYWLEQRPHEQGRTTLMRRRAGASAGAAPAEELTAGRWNLRCRVHEYGGGACAIGHGLAVFVDDADRCLWRLELDHPGAAPVRLTEPGADGRFAGALGGGVIDGPRQRWIGVLESGGRDQLVAVPLGGGAPQRLHQPIDFCGYPALSPCGSRLAWVEWQQPCLPWERSRLWLATVEADGQLHQARPVAGSIPEEGPGLSVFQPLWAGADLVVANDRSGFWNLERWAGAATAVMAEQHAPAWQPLLPMQAEFAMPQWVFGMATTAWDGQRLLAIACSQGRWQLGEVELELEPPHNAPAAGDPAPPAARWRPLAQPCDDLASLTAEAGQLACVGSGPALPSGLLELELASGAWSHTPPPPARWNLSRSARPRSCGSPGTAVSPPRPGTTRRRAAATGRPLCW